jgi:hypothetical protein
MSLRGWLSPAHLAFAFLAAAFAANLLVGGKVELRIQEGTGVELGPIGDLLGMPDPPAASLALRAFEIERYPDGGPKAYRSRVRIEGTGPARDAAIEVNAPLSIGSLRLTQIGWSVAVREIVLEAGGVVASMKDSARILLPDGRKLVVSCASYDKGGLRYAWSLDSGEEGTATKASVPPTLAALGFKVVSEDYRMETVLSAGWRPLLPFLAIAAAAFLALLTRETFSGQRPSAPREISP